MERVAIIHLSDTQFGRKHVFGNPSTVARALAEDVAGLTRQHGFVSLYLLISGDVTETGHGEEFRDAVRELGRLAREIDVEPASILVVPGNHDVSWPLAKMAQAVGTPDLGLENYRRFYRELASGSVRRTHGTPDLTFFHDERYGISFLLMNSCLKETETSHVGFLDPEALRRALAQLTQRPHVKDYLRIAVMHHRLDTTVPGVSCQIENAEEIEAILSANDFSVVLTGHVHQGMCHVVEKHGRRVLYSGCGSSGVDKTQRPDGVPNQYTIHVIDRASQKLETVWRAYNPRSLSRSGLGAWTKDSTEEAGLVSLALPNWKPAVHTKRDSLRDGALQERLNISSNPFVYNNAEKIADDLLLELFVSDETRHKSAKRLSGDAIIRGPRGSGKTMFLRFLQLYGRSLFEQAVRDRQTAECFPVTVSLSRLHRSELGDSLTAYSAAERLIFDSVVEALRTESVGLAAGPFRAAVHRFCQKLDNLKNQSGTPISKLGLAIRETLTPHFNHVLLLLDEVSVVFPRHFFSDRENGFLAWMNSIRSSGPFCTRIAVYPNDYSDILNEERFGTIVNLNYNVRAQDEYEQFKEYATHLVDRYLGSVSLDKKLPATIASVLAVPPTPDADALEQLIYAADGSSRRLLSLLDRCLNLRSSRAEDEPLSKGDAFKVIKDVANNLLGGYSATDQDFAASIAKGCKKASTFRFRMPYWSTTLKSLYASREEFNIVKLIEPRSGSRGSLYEFAYPYCIAMDIQTHYQKESSRVCASRDRVTGEWIQKSTTIEQANLDLFSKQERTHGTVAEMDEENVLIQSDKGDLLGEAAQGLKVGDPVTFIVGADGTALDLVPLSA